MKDQLKARKKKSSFEINWKIREIFSEPALSSFCEDMDNKNADIERKFKQVNQFSVKSFFPFFNFVLNEYILMRIEFKY